MRQLRLPNRRATRLVFRPIGTFGIIKSPNRNIFPALRITRLPRLRTRTHIGRRAFVQVIQGKFRRLTLLGYHAFAPPIFRPKLLQSGGAFATCRILRKRAGFICRRAIWLVQTFPVDIMRRVNGGIRIYCRPLPPYHPCIRKRLPTLPSTPRNTKPACDTPLDAKDFDALRRDRKFRTHSAQSPRVRRGHLNAVRQWWGLKGSGSRPPPQ